jgi:hypothetical protein
MRGLRMTIVMLAVALVAPPALAKPDGCNAACQAELAQARAATDGYRDVQAALADGFVEADTCVSPQNGRVEGIRYEHPARFDGVVDVRHPEGLVYMPEGLGRSERRLAAVTYAVPVTQGGLPHAGRDRPDPDDPPPVLFGRPFDGPLPGRTPGAAWRYELRVWLWSDNPAGRFARANPAEACRMGDIDKPEVAYEDCHEVNGVARVDEERLRTVTGLPSSYDVVGGPDGGARVLLGAITCQKVNGVAASFFFFSPLVESPFGYRGDICCSRYLWKWATDNREYADRIRAGTNISHGDVLHDEGLRVTFDPVVGGTDPQYRAEIPSLRAELAGTATEDAPGVPVSLYFFRPVPQGVRQLWFHGDDVRIRPARAALTLADDSPLAPLFDDRTIDLAPAFTVSWAQGRARLRTQPPSPPPSAATPPSSRGDPCGR